MNIKKKKIAKAIWKYAD